MESAADERERAARIRVKARSQGLSLGTCVAPQAIRDFETSHQVRLPAAYAAFLLWVGNGSEGVYDSAMLYFLDAARPVQPRTERVRFDAAKLAQRFPLTMELDGIEGWPAVARRLDYGTLAVADAGCGQEWRLVVSGPERGHLWFACDAGLLPTLPRLDFLAWFEAGLDGQPWHPDMA